MGEVNNNKNPPNICSSKVAYWSFTCDTLLTAFLEQQLKFNGNNNHVYNKQTGLPESRDNAICLCTQISGFYMIRLYSYSPMEKLKSSLTPQMLTEKWTQNVIKYPGRGQREPVTLLVQVLPYFFLFSKHLIICWKLFCISQANYTLFRWFQSFSLKGKKNFNLDNSIITNRVKFQHKQDR